MAIELSDKTVAIWFLAVTPTTDWMAHIEELEPEASYKLTYRFRHYKDDNHFDSADEKNWYSGTCAGTRAFCIASIRAVGQTMASVRAAEVAVHLGPLYEILNDTGDTQDFMRRLMDAPFAYARQEPAGEG